MGVIVRKNMNWALKAVSAVAVGAMTLGLTGCGGSGEGGVAVEGPWEDVVSAANDEGKISFYSVMPDAQNKRLQKAFSEKYPDIDLQILRGAGELTGRIDAEIQSGSDGADVFLFSDTNWFAEHEENLAKIDGPNLEGWNKESWAVADKAIIPSAYPYSMIVWNTDKFPNGFTGWDDLLDPKVKGTLGLRTDVTPSLAGYLDFMERELGDDYMTKLGQQKPSFYPSAVPMTQSVAAGEIGVANTSTPSVVKEMQDQGAPVKSMIPTPSYWIEWGAGVLEKTKRPNASRVLVDFIMSEEGQGALNGDGFGRASREGIAGSIAPEGDDFSMFNSADFTPDVLGEFNTKFKKWFG
jgi:iron(III) transport system substrate-binding protein